MRLTVTLFSTIAMAGIAALAALSTHHGLAQDTGRATARPDFTNARMLRYPDVSATHICFVYGGDIWTAPKDGGNATRLSSAPGEMSGRPGHGPRPRMRACT